MVIEDLMGIVGQELISRQEQQKMTFDRLPAEMRLNAMLRTGRGKNGESLYVMPTKL